MGAGPVCHGLPCLLSQYDQVDECTIPRCPATQTGESVCGEKKERGEQDQEQEQEDDDDEEEEDCVLDIDNREEMESSKRFSKEDCHRDRTKR